MIISFLSISILTCLYIGPRFVNQSGAFPIRFEDLFKEATKELEVRTKETVKECLSCFGIEATKEKLEMFKWLSM